MSTDGRPRFKIRRKVPQLKKFKIVRKGKTIELKEGMIDSIEENPNNNIPDRIMRPDSSKSPLSPLSPLSPGSPFSSRRKVEEEHEKSVESSELSDTDQEQITSYLL